jgi:dTDP-4-dehydrorhamnose 3,5-epimerase
VEVEQLSIAGALRLTSPVWGDDRGFFREWLKVPELSSAGIDFSVAQANLSRSTRNVVRGLHFSVAPEGQAKVVTCAEGELVDVLVDVREGSPTFGRHELVTLRGGDGVSLYLPSGIGHGFCSISDEAVLVYLLSSTYSPSQELEIHPFDSELAIEWPLTGDPIMSSKDSAAPSLAERRSSGTLPRFGG